MIIFMKNDPNVKIKPMPNMMWLDDIEGDGVVLVSKETYDSTLLLYSKFLGDRAPVKQAAATGKKKTILDIPGAKEFVEEFKVGIPQPLSILSPMLNVLNDIPGLDYTGFKREDFYYLLNQITMFIDVYAFCTTPATVRQTVDVPWSILSNKEITYGNLKNMFIDNTPVQPIVQQVIQTAPIVQTAAPTPVAASPAPAPTAQPTVEEPKVDEDGTTMVTFDWDAVLKQHEEKKKKKEDDSDDAYSSTKSKEEVRAEAKYGIKETTKEQVKETEAVFAAYEM